MDDDRHVVFVIENKTIGEEIFVYKVADILEAYAKDIREGKAGNTCSESKQLDDGTTLQIIACK